MSKAVQVSVPERRHESSAGAWGKCSAGTSHLRAKSLVSVLRLKFCRWWLIPQQISGGEFKVDCV